MEKTFTYTWQWHLQSSPERFWTLISDTNRFNFDTSVPAVTREQKTSTDQLYEKLRFRRFGVPVTWLEEPFEWVYPERFGVVRRYLQGPVKEMRVSVMLKREGNGTFLTYHVEAEPANLLGLAAIPLQIGLLSARQFDKTIRRYDTTLSNSDTIETYSEPVIPKQLHQSRLDDLFRKLSSVCQYPAIQALIKKQIIEGDDFSLSKMRPYAYAKQWMADRRQVLEVFLQATRIGLFDLHWDILCPLCRGTKASLNTAHDISTPVHCNSCHISFDVNFDQLVEITFKPNQSIRPIDVETYCIGGPQVTPHIVAQKIVKQLMSESVMLQLEEGAYRLRTKKHSNGILIKVTGNGDSHIPIEISESGLFGNLESTRNTTFIVQNTQQHDDLFIVERMEFADDAVTAAEITTLQIFRDLFASEALRPGEHVSIGKATLVFTDLKNSTKMYRQIGDAKAFGYVMEHFDVLKNAISANDGALVKTIGDAVMAVFLNPVNALKAMLQARADLISLQAPHDEVSLKTGMHFGTCIAVNLNNNFDYFGSTVNIAARLEGLSSGSDIILSQDVYFDPSVQDWLKEISDQVAITPFETKLKGFENEAFDLFRLEVK